MVIATRLALLVALALPIASGCALLRAPLLGGPFALAPAASPANGSGAKSKPRRAALTASEAYARMNEIEDGVRIVVASEHRRLRRAKTGADAATRRDALAASLANLEPVLRQSEANLLALRSAPAAVRPLLDLRLARMRAARTTLAAGLADVRRGARRDFHGWRERGPRERRAEAALRRHLGVARTVPSLRVASAFDARDASQLRATVAPRPDAGTPFAPSVPIPTPAFGPTPAEIRRDREFFRVAATMTRMIREHNDLGDRFIAEIRAGVPGDRIARLEYLYNVWDVASAEDDRILAALDAIGKPRGETKAYLEATHRQFAASAAEMRRIFALTEDPEEIAARANAYLESVERQRLTGDVQRAADALNARMHWLARRGTVPRADWDAANR